MLILSALIAPLSLTWSPSTGQTFEQLLKQKYVIALQDSAVKYELIKPRMVTLQKSYGFIEQQNQALKNEQRFLSFQHEALKINFEASLADQRKKKYVWGACGVGLGVLLKLIL
ncbi:hypothetical protein [Dyadobacter sp. 676]|uniref:Orphan protein n=1 Tax=Dyadobacter sp. 676 TaxID=3088362 RepID=A0AAU8FNJ4_9BACT